MTRQAKELEYFGLFVLKLRELVHDLSKRNITDTFLLAHKKVLQPPDSREERKKEEKQHILPDCYTDNLSYMIRFQTSMLFYSF